jgi:hypothetical protein
LQDDVGFGGQIVHAGGMVQCPESCHFWPPRRTAVPILQINFKLNVPADAYVSSCQGVVQAIAEVSGLGWKIWILNEHEKEAGGIYFFNTEQALSDYLSGPIVVQLKNHPSLTDVTVKRFEVIEELTSTTRGPVSTVTAAH